MCKKSKENIDHLLLHYEVARHLWVSIFHLFGIVGHAPRGGGVVGLLERLVGSHCNLEVWRIVSLCLMWCSWKKMQCLKL